LEANRIDADDEQMIDDVSDLSLRRMSLNTIFVLDLWIFSFSETYCHDIFCDHGSGTFWAMN
jgi:hypothetical protein